MGGPEERVAFVFVFSFYYYYLMWEMRWIVISLPSFRCLPSSSPSSCSSSPYPPPPPLPPFPPLFLFLFFLLLLLLPILVLVPYLLFSHSPRRCAPLFFLPPSSLHSCKSRPTTARERSPQPAPPTHPNSRSSAGCPCPCPAVWPKPPSPWAPAGHAQPSDPACLGRTPGRCCIPLPRTTPQTPNPMWWRHGSG